MGDCWITLLSGDLAACEAVALRRQAAAERNDRQPRNGAPARGRKALDYNRLGAIGEFAAKCYFDPVEWHDQVVDGYLDRVPDLDDSIDVKASGREWYDLRVQRRGHADRAYVLAAPCRFMGQPTWRVGGWLWGREAMIPKYWGDKARTGMPAFFVPRDELRDIAELLGVLRWRQAARQ